MYRLPVGFRTVRVEGPRFLINNIPFYFKGFGKIQDSDVSDNLLFGSFCFSSQTAVFLMTCFTKVSLKTKIHRGNLRAGLFL